MSVEGYNGERTRAGEYNRVSSARATVHIPCWRALETKNQMDGRVKVLGMEWLLVQLDIWILL